MADLAMNTIEQYDIDSNQFLTFILSGEEFAVPIMQVKEIIQFQALTRVPMVPDFISGALNLRGSVIPVINLSRKFGMEQNEKTRRTCVVIMEVELDNESTTIGVLVDRVLDVVELNDGAIDSAPSLGTQIRTDFIRGMARIGDNFVIILAVNKVLSAQEIAVVGNLGGQKEEADDEE